MLRQGRDAEHLRPAFFMLCYLWAPAGVIRVNAFKREKKEEWL